MNVITRTDLRQLAADRDVNSLALRTGVWLEAVESGNIPGGGMLAAVTRYEYTPAAVTSFHDQNGNAAAGAAR